jgi:hypothetical protein
VQVPFSHHVGELRAHYAGFFDPGFGYGVGGELSGAVGVLEVRPTHSAHTHTHTQHTTHNRLTTEHNRHATQKKQKKRKTETHTERERERESGCGGR